MKLRLIVLFAIGLVIASPSFAQNVVTNPNFDTTLSGWSTVVYATWDNTLDFGGNTPTNGSARGTTGPGSGTLAGNQCFTVTPSTSYSFGGMVYVRDALMSGYIGVAWYTSTDCTSGVIGSNVSPTISTVGSWNASNGPNPVTSPATAQSVNFTLGFNNAPAATGPGSVNFDNVFFGPGTFPVSLQDFSVD